MALAWKQHQSVRLASILIRWVWTSPVWGSLHGRSVPCHSSHRTRLSRTCWVGVSFIRTVLLSEDWMFNLQLTSEQLSPRHCSCYVSQSQSQASTTVITHPAQHSDWSLTNNSTALLACLVCLAHNWHSDTDTALVLATIGSFQSSVAPAVLSLSYRAGRWEGLRWGAPLTVSRERGQTALGSDGGQMPLCMFWCFSGNVTFTRKYLSCIYTRNQITLFSKKFSMIREFYEFS